jgi:5-methylcytosine-specific restriction protein A
MRSASSRGYGKAWQKVRKQFLDTHPLYEGCMKEGRYVNTTDVDHIIAHRGDPNLFWDQDNWQALCHRHHSMKTDVKDLHPVYRY